MKIAIKRYISYLLVIVLMLASIPTVQAHAEKKENVDVITDVVDTFEHENEKSQEAKDDYWSPNRSGNWGLAVNGDYYHWNTFHNEVQKAICEDGLINRELKITYGKNNDKDLQGKTGKADLYLVDDRSKIIYLWEVKPLSYAVDADKNEAGLKQLKNYLDSDPEDPSYSYERGKGQIADGQVVLVKEIPRLNDQIEEVKYVVDYFNAQDGMIYYKFTRSSKMYPAPKKAKDNEKTGEDNGENEDDEDDDNTITDIAAIRKKP